MVYDYEEGQSLEECIYAAIHRYDDSRSDHYGSFEGDAGKIANAVNDLGDHLSKAVFDLTVPDELVEIYRRGNTIIGILDSINSEVLRSVILENLEIHMAFAFSTDVSEKAKRALELSRYLLAQNPDTEVGQYLNRVSRAYVAGFFPECVILCRSVLEQAMRVRYRREKKPPPPKFRHRINEAERNGWLSGRAKSAAHTIWTRGNKAVHDDPNMTQDIYGTIALLWAVLTELVPPERSSAA